MLRATVYINNSQYADLRRLLVLRRQSFSEWVRDKMHEALLAESPRDTQEYNTENHKEVLAHATTNTER